MKALTIRQPWASLIVAGIKDVENRSWPTSHRGLLYVHAGSAVDREAMALHGHLLEPTLPSGAIIGTVELINCVRAADSRWAEPGQWHWLLADPQQLPVPVPCRGALGLWRPPADVLG